MTNSKHLRLLRPANEIVYLMGFCFFLQPGHPVAVCQQSAEANECLSGGEALQLLSSTKIGIFFFSNADFLPTGVCVKGARSLAQNANRILTFYDFTVLSCVRTYNLSLVRIRSFSFKVNYLSLK